MENMETRDGGDNIGDTIKRENSGEAENDLTNVAEIEHPLEVPAFYTPSMMMGTMNETMKSVGGSVELKRKLDNGTLISSTEGERKAADMSAKMRQSAEEVKGMEFEGKLEWSRKRREVGNKLFKREEWAEAMDVYMTCLVAISNEEGEVEQSEREISLPVLLNLAQCALNLRSASKAIKFCDHAESLGTGVGREDHKVLFRRGKARVMRGEFRGAKKDLDSCLEVCERKGIGEKETKAVAAEIRKLEVLVRKGKKDEEVRRKAMKKVMQGQGGDRVYGEDEGGTGKVKKSGKSGKVDKVSDYDSSKEAQSEGEESIKKIKWGTLAKDVAPFLVLFAALWFSLKKK